MDERSEHVEHLPPPPPGGGGATSAGRRARTVRLPDPGSVAGVPPVPDVLRGAVDPDTPFRRALRAPVDDGSAADDWAWPAPPPPAIGPLPAPPPPRPVDPSAAPGSDGWHDLAGPAFAASDEPLAAPRRRRPPWRLLAAGMLVVAGLVVGTAVLGDDGGNTVVDRGGDAFAEQPALDEAPQP